MMNGQANWYTSSRLPCFVAATVFASLPGTLIGSETESAFWNEPEVLMSAEELIAIEANDCPVVTDMMENEPTSANWDVSRMKPKRRFKVQSKERREGQKALGISLKKKDATNRSGKYKHELWIANSKRCLFGEEVWYSFSFRINGEFPRTGTTRWVIGQWKEETEGSPFLAQRFDNGVFHISIQENDKRMIIASAPGDYDAKFRFFTDAFRESLPMADGEIRSDLDWEKEIDRFSFEGRDAFSYSDFREAIMNQDVSGFPFLADPESLMPIEGLTILPSENPFLPDPNKGWVDMRYRVKGDRQGNGLIEVWADDRFIVRVTGKIGNDDFAGPTQYFKMGHYRDTDRDFRHATLYFDNFRRGTSRGDVD